MKRNISFIIITFIIAIFIGCQANNQAEVTSSSTKTSKANHPFINLLVENIYCLAQSFDQSKKISQGDVLKLLWGGNGIVDRKKNDNDKEVIYLTHPTNFASLLNLYLIDNKGVHRYDNEEDELVTIKEGNLLNKINAPQIIQYKTPSYILLSRIVDEDRLLKGVESLSGNYNDEVIANLKDFVKIQEKSFEKSALIELGASAQNIMLLANAYGYSYYPISVQGESSTLKKELGITDVRELPIMLIALGTNDKKGTNSSQVSYINKLFSIAKNSKKENFDQETSVATDIIRQLCEAGNGAFKASAPGQSIVWYIGHSGLANSIIQLYYINKKQLRVYDPSTKTLKTLKYGDYTNRLGDTVARYPVNDYLVIAINRSKFKFSDYQTLIPSKSTASYYNNILNDYNAGTDLALYQVGAALQNIRLIATDYQLAYQHIEIKKSYRSRLATILDITDEPVFVIPFSNKTEKK